MFLIDDSMVRRRSRRVVAALVAALVSAAAGDEVRLSTGEVLTVSGVCVTETSVRFTHPVLGTLTLPRESVTVVSVSPPPAAGSEAGQGAAEPPAEPVMDEAHELAKAKEAAVARVEAEFKKQKEAESERVRLNTASFIEGWRGNVALGANGSDGNTDTLSVRAGAGASRIAELMETRAGIVYTYATDEGTVSKDRAEANILNDWLFRNSPLGLFAKGRAEYDQFQDWDWRLSGFGGPSYTFVKSDAMTFRGRVGAGITEEIGGTQAGPVPEGLAGLDFEYKFSKTQSVLVTCEVLPSLDDLSEYRVNTKAGYKLIIDPTSNLSFNMGLEDRYNSDPGAGFKRNDLEYFALLGLDF
ncbi:MAG: DUF481 domain-containing protein [Planctomycetes bacterium]|nr:DUF481 domain-containing protein [Planctomycetota bacterium]